GGTPGFMPPEQRAALAAVAEGRPVPAAVDSRADLFALGALLHVALGGAPAGPAAAPLHRLNPAVSVGPSGLLPRCLAAEARARYPDAAALAADLRRHRGDRPLKGVANRSLTERWRKWRRRRPDGLARGCLAVAVLALLAAVAAGVFDFWNGRRHQA